MFSGQLFTHSWRLWESLFEHLDLPWDARASAILGLVAVLVFVGLLLKLVMESEN